VKGWDPIGAVTALAFIGLAIYLIYLYAYRDKN